MRLDFNGIVQYVRAWIKDTAGKEIDEPLARRFVNMAYLESADRAMWKLEEKEVTLVAGTGEYSVTTMGIDNMIRPSVVLYDGSPIDDKDYRAMASAGYMKSDAQQGVPSCVNFQKGSMLIRPIPDTDAATKTITILYAASPAELTVGDPDSTPVVAANLSLDDKFRTAWQEIIAWLVLRRMASVPRAEEELKLFMSPNDIKRECDERLDRLHKDVWATAVSARRLKDESGEKDASMLDRNFFTT